MLFSNNSSLLEAWLMVINTAHEVLTYVFIICVLKIVLQKYSPYSQIYMASFVSVQVLWNGCPISEFVNFFNKMGNYQYEINGFFFGFAGEYSEIFRVIALGLAGLLFWSAYETWYKVDSPFEFGNYIKRGDFKMV